LPFDFAVRLEKSAAAKNNQVTMQQHWYGSNRWRQVEYVAVCAPKQTGRNPSLRENSLVAVRSIMG